MKPVPRTDWSDSTCYTECSCEHNCRCVLDDVVCSACGVAAIDPNIWECLACGETLDEETDETKNQKREVKP